MSAGITRSYPDAVRFLYGLQGYGVKLGLANIRRFLRERGSPHRSVPWIHVAGSNGKGSTAAMLAAVLTSTGRRTALYTSPHLVDFRERIRIDGVKIPRAYVADWVARHRAVIRRRKLTFFEATTALAFDWFDDAGAEIGVLETGLGGRLDATNVVRPLLSVITTISREHVHILGTTLASIAQEKAGIVKQGVPVVLAESRAVVRTTVRRIARARRAPVIEADRYRLRSAGGDDRSVKVEVRAPDGTRRWYVVGLAGLFQAVNARTVLAAVDVLRTQRGMEIREEDVRRGLRDVRKLTGLEGRFSRLSGRRRVYVDVAHNPGAMQQLAKTWRRLRLPRPDVVFGIAADKEYRPVMRALSDVAGRWNLVRPRTFRGRDTRSLARYARALGSDAHVYATVAEGVRAAMKDAGRRPVLITGSHFVVGEALAFLQRRNYLTISQ